MGARISILQIATPQMVYIFGTLHSISLLLNKINILLDIIKGGNQLFEQGGLKDLLQDPTIMKITHDCR